MGIDIINQFTPAQSEIIKDICFKQLDSLRRLYQNKPMGSILIENELKEHNIKIEDFKDEIENKLFKFKQLSRNHKTLATMTKEDLSVFRHILANLEDQYKNRYPKAVSNLWQKLFFIEGLQVQNLN